MSEKKQKTILLVEDEAVIAVIEAELLKKEGYRVLTASTGEQACDLVCAGKEGIDLVLMDIDLGPGIDGAEAARRILDGCELPVVFLSAHSEKNMVDRIEGISSYGYVLKDSRFDALGISIKMAFRLFASRLAERLRSRALQESELLFHALFEKNQAVKLLIDPEYRMIIDANSAAARFYGYSLPKLRTMGFADILTVPRDEVGRIVAGLAAENGAGVNLRHRLANGELRDVEVFASPIEIGGRILVHAIIHDITERKSAEDRIRSLLAEKELVLKEVHHRIKNNMNTIFGLLTLQAASRDNLEARDVLSDAASRVQSMMVLYDKLYRSENNEAVSLAAYIPALVREILDIFPEHETIRVVTDVEDIRVQAGILSSLGIILNELITNSMKYAFKGRSGGVITVTARSAGNQVSLSFADDGIGIKGLADNFPSAGFGMQLVHGLVEQIHGTVRLESGSGTRYDIEFPA